MPDANPERPQKAPNRVLRGTASPHRMAPRLDENTLLLRRLAVDRHRAISAKSRASLASVLLCCRFITAWAWHAPVTSPCHINRQARGAKPAHHPPRNDSFLPSTRPVRHTPSWSLSWFSRLGRSYTTPFYRFGRVTAGIALCIRGSGKPLVRLLHGIGYFKGAYKKRLTGLP